MGVIRGILLVFVCVFLFVSLLLVNIFFTLNMSLDYENVKAEIGSIIDSNNLEMVLEENSTTSIVEQIYYDDYDCEFLNCFEKTGSPLFLISEKAKDYWNSKLYFILLISLGLIALVFLLVDKKSNTFIITGILLMVVALPFMKLDWALSFISEGSFLGLLDVFFSESYTVFVISFVFGIVLLGIGILLKLFKIGFKISKIISKFSKKEPKGKKSTSKEVFLFKKDKTQKNISGKSKSSGKEFKLEDLMFWKKKKKLSK